MFAGRKLPLTLVFVALVALVVGVSCKGFFVDPTVTSLAISPLAPTIAVTSSNGAANTQQFSAIGSFSDNSPPAAIRATWGSSNLSVATINSTSGLATAAGIGTTTITATSTQNPTISNTTTLTIVPANVTSITVTPSGQSTSTGSTIFLKAVDQSGNDISASVVWTFTLQGTTTQETGITKTAVENATQGQQFTVGTLTPAVTTFPVTLNVVASLTTTSGTVTSTGTVTLTITS